MDAIGGYFSLELPMHEEFHKNAIKLNTGRICLEYILRCRKYKKVYIPYYTCEVILEPFKKLGIEYSFYHINIDFEIVEDTCLNSHEAILYTNYWGLNQHNVIKYSERYGRQLIIDNTQAFYAKPIEGIDTFYTCRKFFGVPDGAYLYTDAKLGLEIEQDVSYERVTHLLKRIDLGAEAGFMDFRKADDALDNQPMLRMSRLTERMMQAIDYGFVARRRKDNFMQLHGLLKDGNLLHLQYDEEAVPMVYPYLMDKEGLRESLIRNKIFVARYWPNVDEWAGGQAEETTLAKQLIPLPVDQRYGEVEMECIINKIKEFV
ncbi:MAG: hypothetical protein IJ635_00145 [Bacteroidaceae bacterium]|nr:hypothetical protein [Bacteroidaceae bacterium]